MELFEGVFPAPLPMETSSVFHLWLLFRDYHSLYVPFRKSSQMVSVLHRWHCSAKHLRFSHTWIKTHWKWKMKNQPTRNGMYTLYLPYNQHCVSSGRNIKEAFIETTNKDGMFCKISLPNFITWHKEILFIHSFLLGVYHKAGISIFFRGCEVTSDRDLTQIYVSKKGGYYKR